MNENKRFGYYLGRAVGLVIVSCLGICICAVAIALTASFIHWLI